MFILFLPSLLVEAFCGFTKPTEEISCEHARGKEM
jgi:hypothetical protein